MNWKFDFSPETSAAHEVRISMHKTISHADESKSRWDTYT